MIKETFGDYLRCKRGNISAAAFAKEVGISSVYLLDIEKGARNVPKREVQIRIANCLKLSTEEKYHLYDLGATGKEGIPADVWMYITGNSGLIKRIRNEAIIEESQMKTVEKELL